MKKGNKSEAAVILHQKAEALLKNKQPKSRLNLSEAETMKLIHELEVHQIELELQNEELALAKEQGLKAAAEKYAELYNFAPAGIFTLTQKGEIIEINQYGSQMLGKESFHLKNSVFNFFVSNDTKPIFNLFLNKIFKSKTEESCQVILSESVNPPMYLQLTGLTTKNGEQCLVTAVDISKRKRTEKALVESETKYRTMVTQSPDGVFIVDLSGTFLSVNKAMCDNLKYTEEEFLSMKILDIVAEQNQPHHKQRLAAMINGETTNANAEYEITGKDGIVHSVEVRSAPFYKGKELIGFQGIAREITERKIAEKVLRKSEEKYRNIFENIQNVYYETTIDGIIIEVSPSINYMSKGQYTRDDLIGKSMFDFYTNSLERHALLSALKEHGKVTDFEILLKIPNCLEIPCSISSILHLDAQGHPDKIIGSMRDITERKQEEEKLHDSREDLNRLLNSIAEGAYGMDINGNCNFVNRAFLKILGYQDDNEILGKHIHELIHHSHYDGSPYPSSECRMHRVHQTNQPINVTDEVFWRKDGVAIPVEYWSHPIVKDGVVIGSIATFIDITERKSAEEALIASETRYRRLFESAKDGILILDSETGKIMDVNPFLVEILGYSKEIFIEKEIWEIGFFKDIVANKNKFLELQQKEYVRYDNLPLETADGRKINVEFVSNVYLVDKKKVIQCNIRDITERKRIENALIASKNHLRMLVQTIPDLIWTKDVDGTYLSCNAMFERFFGASEADIIGKTDYDFVDRKLADFFRENDQKAMEAGKPKSNEEWITFADDGHRAYLETIKTPMFDAQNRLIGILGIGRDITDRKSAEQKIRENEKRFRTIFSQAPIGIALLDAQGQLIIANTPLSEMVGYSCDELSKMKFADFTYSEDIDKDQEQFNDLIDGKISVYSMEKRYVHKNGNLVWANLFVTILRDENGDFREILGMAEDISERKQTEKEIAMLAYSLKSVNECVSITDINDKIVFVNESFLKTYGYDISELIGKHISIVRSQNNKQVNINEILLATISGEWKGELLNKKKDGSEFPIYLSTSIIKDKDGSPLGLIGVATDITERKRAEETLMKLLSALEQTVDTLVITDRNGTIEYVNHAFEDVTGYSSEEALGKTPRILKSGTKDQNYYEGLWKTILSGKVFRSEILNKRKNGDLYYVEKTISPIFDKNKDITHFVGTGTDITERKRAEKELIKAKDKAEENDRLKTAFLQNMSHEIRTPMNAIVGFTELVEMEINDPDKIRDYTQIIRRRSDDLLGIINDLLDIARIESDQLSIKYAQVDLNKLLEELRSLYAEHNLQIEKPSINLLVKGIPNNFNSLVSTDAGKLKQIFSNLIHNAFKFTSEGKIEFGFHSINNNRITFFVSDSGTGIPKNIKNLIFERFRKSADESVYVQDGMGLGLAIVKGLLKLFSGEIRVESELNEGSTFFFTIPYIPILVKNETETPVKDQKYDWSNFTLLIVEDDRFNITYFTELLRSTGINLLIGETGNQAISLFADNPKIDLVLMDIKLPDMSGYEVTKEFKKLHPETPIIAQTAYAAESDKQKALDAGCADFITKPIQRNILLELINRYLNPKPTN